MDKETHKIYERAVELFKSGISQNMIVNDKGKVKMPIRIISPDGKMSSWFVGIVVENKIVSFMRFDIDLRLMEHSMFYHQSRSLDECPLAKIWLDPNTVLELAKTRAASGDELMEPVLSYDKSPSRIAWAVKFKNESRKIGTIFVAGEYVYRVLEN